MSGGVDAPFMPGHFAEVMTARLTTTRIGDNWVVRSPDVPELFVAHRERAIAEANVPAALAMNARMKDRLAARETMRRRAAARVRA